MCTNLSSRLRQLSMSCASNDQSPSSKQVCFPMNVSNESLHLDFGCPTLWSSRQFVAKQHFVWPSSIMSSGCVACPSPFSPSLARHPIFQPCIFQTAVCNPGGSPYNAIGPSLPISSSSMGPGSSSELSSSSLPVASFRPHPIIHLM